MQKLLYYYSLNIYIKLLSAHQHYICIKIPNIYPANISIKILHLTTKFSHQILFKYLLRNSHHTLFDIQQSQQSIPSFDYSRNIHLFIAVVAVRVFVFSLLPLFFCFLHAPKIVFLFIRWTLSACFIYGYVYKFTWICIETTI